jgi:ABC-type antimicrobial peptide transport system, permease component
MLRNYLVVAYRSLRRHLGSTLVNLSGLAIGVAVCLLFGTLSWSLLTWDAFHPESDRLYHLYLQWETSDGWSTGGTTGGTTLQELKTTFPAVETGTRELTVSHIVSPENGDRSGASDSSGGHPKAFEASIDYVDSTFFQVMGFRLARGDPETVLDRPDAAVLGEETARTYFGTANPVGKTLRLDGESTVTVTGIVADPPPNTNLDPEIVVNIAHARMNNIDHRRESLTNGGGAFLSTYVRLQEGTDPEALVTAINGDFLTEKMGPNEAEGRRYRLVNVADVPDLRINADTHAYLLLAMALVLLLLAIANVTNLATARSLERAQETGVRKALGARRGGLAAQFLMETQLLALGALVVGLTAAQLLLPVFSAFLELELQIAWTDPAFWGAVVGLGLFVGLLAGAYPAVVLSGFRPSTVLRGDLQSRPGGTRLRRGLLGVQFALALLLVAGTFGIQRQIQYVESKVSALPLDEVVRMRVQPDFFDSPEAGRKQLATLRTEVLRSSAVVSASVSNDAPGSYGNGDGYAARPGGKERVMRHPYVGPGYFDTYDLKIVEGHGFDEATDTERERGVVVNQATMRALGWDTIEGKTLHGGDNPDAPIPVIGVVEDFHFHTLRESIKPAVHSYADLDFGWYDLMSVRAAGPVDEAVEAVRAAWADVGIPAPFDYRVAGDEFSGLSIVDQKLSGLVTYAAVLALLIAAMGLFAMASLTVTQRQKEIGIRKALGASVSRIAWLLSSQFALLVAGAAVVALPLAYWGVQQWLQGYAYRVDLSGWTFALAGVAVMAVALLTVATQVVRAARLDPATTLRDE